MYEGCHSNFSENEWTSDLGGSTVSDFINYTYHIGL